MKTVRLLDLTAAQVLRIEQATGTTMDKWQEAPKGLLFPAILAEVEGVDASTFDDVPMRDLVARISMESDEGE